MRSVALAAALLVSTTAAAQAQSRAWTLAARIMLERDPDARQVVATVKRACGIDIATALDSIDIDAVDPRTGRPTGVFVIGLAGVDESQLAACIPKYARASGKRVTATRGPDRVTQIDYDGDVFYVAFPSPYRLAVALDPADRPVLARMLPRAPATPSSRTPPPAAPAPATPRPRTRLQQAADRIERELIRMAAAAAHAEEQLRGVIDDVTGWF